MSEQKAALQARMIEAYQAAQAGPPKKTVIQESWVKRIADARTVMRMGWDSKVSGDLMQLLPSAEELLNYESVLAVMAQSTDKGIIPTLVLAYEGIFVELRMRDTRYRFGVTESEYYDFETAAEAEQAIWAYFGKRLTEQAAAERTSQSFDEAIEPVLDAVVAELEKACRKHGAIRNQHELYAVLLEELQEFWEEVRKAQVSSELSPEAIKELIQIAAMGLRGLLDLGAFK